MLPFIHKDKSTGVLDNNQVDVAVIAGWEFGLQGIKAGEKRTLIMNAAVAYGAAGTAGIPGNATLRFDVQCVSILSKPRLTVASLGGDGTPLQVLLPGQTTFTSSGTVLSLAAGQTSTTQKFSLLSDYSDNANGISLGNVTISSVTLSGTGAGDFSVRRSGQTLILTFTRPTSAGARNATVHVHSNDPLHPDFTFAVRGVVVPSVSTGLA